MPRPDFPTYHMRDAYHTATRATCDRKHVGAVIVSPDNRIVAKGYNGAPKGTPSCDEVGHELVDGHCVRSIHAEANALLYAGREAMGCDLYVTVIPCYDCAKLLVQAGISRVYYDGFYESRYGKSHQTVVFLQAAGIVVEKVQNAELSAFKELLAALDKH